ncbi:unnamed protein product [Ixodes pacificus]
MAVVFDEPMLAEESRQLEEQQPSPQEQQQQGVVLVPVSQTRRFADQATRPIRRHRLKPVLQRQVARPQQYVASTDDLQQPQQQQRRQREAPAMVLVPAQPRYVAAPATAQVAYVPAASSSEADLKPSATGYGHQAEGYLDMGAYSGNYGAFGWYADYPVGGGYH